MSFYDTRDIKSNRGGKLKDGRLVRHQCDWCAGYIEIGQPMVRASWVWDGDFSTAKLHLECHIAAQELMKMANEIFYDGSYHRGSYSDGYCSSPRFPAMRESDYLELLKHDQITPYAEYVEKTVGSEL